MMIDTDTNMMLVDQNHNVAEFKFPLKKEQLCDEPADTYRFWVKAKKSF